jgi:general secretion pathway protein L
MHILAIDVGSYSVKYISSFVEKRKVTHVEMSEIVLRDYLTDFPEMSFEEGQIKVVQEIIDNNVRPGTRVIFQANNEMMTTRFLTLPTKSKKTADRMLPFNLEEDIPYSLSEVHYAYRMDKQKTQHTAIVGLVRENTFEAYYNLLREKNTIPDVLTLESSVTENYFNQNAIAGPFCLIDIGHKTTKAYFFYNSKLLITHVSYVGGHHVNEMIADTYKIDMDEAIIYKHQNAFFLTESQYEAVEPSQKEFALAMDKVFAPLLTDFARWKIGLKVNYNLNLGHIFISGGSANIKNIANYLTEKMDVQVALLESFDKVDAQKVDLNPKNKSKFTLANMMAIGFKQKNRFINLLTGRFAQSGQAELPLHSFAFIGVRAAAACLLIAVSVGVERFFIQRDIAFVNAKIGTLLKEEDLQLNNRLRRAFLQNPKPVFDSLVKRQRGVKQEISTLQAAMEIKALSPLVTISQIAASSEATMTEFKNTEIGEIRAVFAATDLKVLQNLKATLDRSNFTDVSTELDETKLTLTMTATGN